MKKLYWSFLKMKIAFYKPGKKLYITDDTEDYASWSYEVVNIMKIFADKGHECYFLSPSDYSSGIKNIFVGSYDTKYDRVFFHSGMYDDQSLLDLSKIKSDNIDLYFTDLRLWPPDSYMKYFRRVYSIQRDFPDRLYAGNNESYLYHMYTRPLAKKDIYCYYGGGERDRLNKIFEYVLRPNTLWTGRADSFKSDTRLYDKKEYLKTMDRAKYSICIVDGKYSETHAITQRFYEHVIHNIVSFVDNDFDKLGFMIPLDAWFRVNNYPEMYEKMKFLDLHPEEYVRVLQNQKKFLKDDYFNGNYVYDLLK
jgi:hypothetical protein